MPYNFEATFVQPLLAKLDNGVIKGADDWAHAITNAYIATIRTGLPQGVPATLPAPGLNPTAPPPYPIGTSPFTTTNIKGTAMYNIVHAYFLAKEVTLEKGAIQSLAATVKQMILKLKERYRQIKRLIELIKLTKEELQQLPKLLTNLVQDIKDELKLQVRSLVDLVEQTRLSEASLDSDSFKRVFSEELSIIEDLKNFQPDNPARVLQLSVYLSSLSKRGSVVNPTKNYLRSKLRNVVGELLNFANALIDPSKYITYLSNLASTRTRIKSFVKRVKQFDTFVRYIQPKLAQLEIKKNALVSEVRNTIQPKLVEIQKKLRAKIKELTNKLENSKAVSLYKNASKSVADLKAVYNKKTKKINDKIKLGKKIAKKTIDIGIKVDTLYTNIRFRLENAKTTLSRNVEAVKEIYPQQELKNLHGYLNKNDLGDIANICASVLVESKCSFQAFKNYFESNSKVVKQYAKEIQSLKQDFDELSQLIKEFKKHSKDISHRKETKFSGWLDLRVKSFKDLFNLLHKTVRPYIKSVQADIKVEVDVLVLNAKSSLKKANKDIEVFALNLIPLKSDVVDKKDKAATAESKRITLDHKIARGKDLAVLYSHYYKAVKGFINIFLRLAKSTSSMQPIRLSENRTDIDKLLTGCLFIKYREADYKKQVYERVNHVVIEKKRLMKKFDKLIVIESLTLGVIETLKNIKDSPFLNDLEDFYNSLSEVPGKQSLKAFIDLCKNPPTKISELLDTVNNTLVALLQDRVIANKILALELRYLQKSRALVDSLVDIDKSSLSDAQLTLLKIKNELDKNRSFIKIGFQLLAKELKEFFNFLNSLVAEFVDFAKKKLDAKKEKIKKQHQDTIKKQKEKRVNSDAALMTVLFGIAARSFWTGTRWTGPTGTQHISLNIGVFTRIKARSTDGASAMIREMARGFQNQLNTMQGLVIPPANTGIPPIPFIGYK